MALTLNSDIGVTPGLPERLRDAPQRLHDHTHAHGHDHGHDAAPGVAQAHDAGAGFSPFLASALDRLGVAVILTGFVWIAVFWAVR